jgi:hypothetical protein
MHFEWNRTTGKRARITVAEFAHAVMRVALHYLALSLLLSFLMSYNYRPFPSTVHAFRRSLTVVRLVFGMVIAQ